MTNAMSEYYNLVKPRPYTVFDTLVDLQRKEGFSEEQAIREVISKLGPISERDIRAIAKRR